MKTKEEKEFEEKFKERLRYYNFSIFEIKAIIRVFNFVKKNNDK